VANLTPLCRQLRLHFQVATKKLGCRAARPLIRAAATVMGVVETVVTAASCAHEEQDEVVCKDADQMNERNQGDHIEFQIGVLFLTEREQTLV